MHQSSGMGQNTQYNCQRVKNRAALLKASMTNVPLRQEDYRAVPVVMGAGHPRCRDACNKIQSDKGLRNFRADSKACESAGVCDETSIMGQNMAPVSTR